MPVRSIVLCTLLCGACAAQGPSGSTSSPAPVVAGPATPAPEEAPAVQPASDVPFVGDTVSTSALGEAGWTCAANEIGNTDCSRPMEVEGIGTARISAMLTESGQVSILNLSATQPELTPASSVVLSDTLAALAGVRGWTCGPTSELGTHRPCTQDARTVHLEIFPTDGYATASITARDLQD